MKARHNQVTPRVTSDGKAFATVTDKEIAHWAMTAENLTALAFYQRDQLGSDAMEIAAKIGGLLAALKAAAEADPEG